MSNIRQCNAAAAIGQAWPWLTAFCNSAAVACMLPRPTPGQIVTVNDFLPASQRHQ